MSSPHRRPTLLVLLLCTGGLGASCPTSTITVPLADPYTHPDVVLDVHFAQGPILTITPANAPPVAPQLGANEEISLVASCTDNDSGCRNIEIFAEVTATNTNGSVVPPAVPGPPVAQSLDPNAAPGGTAGQKRNTSVKLSVAQLRGTAGLKLHVWARATNAHNEQWLTKKVSLYWTDQAQLQRPDCPRFFGSVKAVVLDSRLVTIGIQNARAADPARTIFKVGLQEPLAPRSWLLEITEAPIAPTSATFELVDETGWNRELLTVDSRNHCNVAGTTWPAAANSSSGDLTVDSSTTTTIVLREPNTGLGAYGMHDVAVFNEATFWPAFGGKRTKITWKQ
jgi:hypothetical protein